MFVSAQLLSKERYAQVRLESLSNDDGNGSENVTQKVNSRCFKLYRSYFNTFNLSNVDDFSGVEF